MSPSYDCWCFLSQVLLFDCGDYLVHRELAYFPPRVELERVVVPHHGQGDDSLERSPPVARATSNHHNEQPAAPFSLERDYSLEDAVAITHAVDLDMAPPPAEGSLMISDPFDDTHGIPTHIDPAGSLGTHGYNPSIQSTFNSFSANSSFEEAHEVVRNIAEMRLQRTLPRSDEEYPEYIRDTLAHISELLPARTNYNPLWNHVLEYWFPPTEGFDIVQNWDPSMALFGPHHIVEPQLQNITEILQRSNPSFAVFDVMFPTQPFLCVNIHNAASPVDEFMKIEARVTLEETFETLRACSAARTGLKSLCVVSAVGAKWGMVVREPGWSQNDQEMRIDCVGEWEDDVTSSESFNVMKYCFGEMKKGS